MFQLTQEQFEFLRSQSVTSSQWVGYATLIVPSPVLTRGIIFDTIRFGKGSGGDMKGLKSVDWKEEITGEGS
jgi:hypothetical protein